MAVGQRRPGRLPPEAARRELVDELLGPPPEPHVPELYAGHAKTTFEIAPPTTPTAHESVGVVFVHGVGSQQKGDTLREFATPLVDWVEEWHRSRGMLTKVTWAELSQPGEPASAALILPECPNEDPTQPPYPKQRWMLAEAWWAPRVAAPEYVTMLSWAWNRVPWLIDGLWDGAQQAWREPVFFSSDPTGMRRGARAVLWNALAFIERLGQVLNTIAISALYVITQLALMLVLAVLGVIARLPLPGLNEFVLVKLIRPLIIDNVGDFYVFVYDRIQATHIRQSIYETVNWLVKTVGCTRVVIAAHSGGTVIAVDALGTPDLRGQDGRPLPHPMEVVDTLVTFGAALNRAWDEGYGGVQGKPARPIPERLHPPARWLNFWTHFDWAHPGRELDHGLAGKDKDPDEQRRLPNPLERNSSIEVINGISPITDHGSYLTNYEHFVSALAQVVEGAARTRFSEGGPARDRFRRTRVGMLTLWRAVAVVSALAVVGYRYVVAGRDAVSDGAALWSTLTQIPAVGGVLGAIGSVAGSLSAIPGAIPLSVLGLTLLVTVTWAALAASRLTLLSLVLFWTVALALVDPSVAATLQRGVYALAAVLVLLLASGIAYWLFIAVFFTRWDARLSLLSARAAPGAPRVATTLPPMASPDRTPGVAVDLIARTALYLVVAAALAFGLASAPSFADALRIFTTGT